MGKKRARLDDDYDSDNSWEADEAGFGEETHNLLDRTETSDDDAPEAPRDGKGRLRLRQSIVLDGLEYAGEKSNRKDLFNEQDDDEPLTDEELRSTRLGDFESDDEFALEPGNADEDFEAVNREYEELQKEEEKMLQSLRGQSESDVKKGRAVRHQKELWDRALDTRIALQKLITDANRLPEEEQLDSVDEKDEVKKEYEKLRASALRTLNTLVDLDDAMVEKNGAVLEQRKGTPKAAAPGPATDITSAWDRLSYAYARFVPYRNNALDRWHRKTQISTGAAAAKGKLKAFNQSISQQVMLAMKDPSRLVTRMLTKCTNPVLREVAGQSNVPVEVPDSTNEEKKPKPAGECFDDSEFYQQLLKEFLESSDPNALGIMNHEAIRKLRNKKRKVVDRRASKGRKIRYTVHEPLVNFMAPEPISLPPMATKLFTSLFGTRSTTLEVAA